MKLVYASKPANLAGADHLLVLAPKTSFGPRARAAGAFAKWLEKPLHVLVQELGAVLVQFPWSFKRSVESEEWLGGVFQALAGLPLVLEVRHASWEAPDFLAELAERAVGIVNVDQPMFSRSIAPAARVTAAVAYVRVHGRNFRDWFREGAGRDARYDYLYRADELRPWAARVKQLDADPSRPDVYVVTNNHFEGKAVANARMLEAMVRGKKVGAPAPLLDRYAKVLGPYAVPEDGPPPAPPGRTAPPAQGTLF